MVFSMGRSFLGSWYSCNLDWLIDYVNSLLLGVLLFVLVVMVYLFINAGLVSMESSYFSKSEVFCGVIPIVILFLQVYPSFIFLYDFSFLGFKGDVVEIKVSGHQWFWSYEYGGFGDWLKYDSYLLGLGDLALGSSRMVEVDERLVVPQGVDLIFTFYSYDVIHSWSLPVAGIKVDVMPGVFSIYGYNFSGVGVYRGMCSEFCGVGHSFMPIVVEVVPKDIFYMWVEDRKHMFDITTRLGDWYSNYGVSSFY